MKKMQCEFSSEYLQQIFYMSSEQLDIYLRNSCWEKKKKEKEGNIEYLAFPLISLSFLATPGSLQDFIS